MYALQPEKKNRGCVNILAAIGLVTLGIVSLLGIVVVISMLSIGNLSASSQTHNVMYKATTDRLKYNDCFGFDATYEMPSGTSQKGGGLCGVGNSVVVDQRRGNSGDFVYLSIQNDEWAATIGCEIYIDGKLVYQNHSDGQYVIASCNGSIP